jgi:hypothetical protein
MKHKQSSNRSFRFRSLLTSIGLRLHHREIKRLPRRLDSHHSYSKDDAIALSVEKGGRANQDCSDRAW